MIYKSKRKFFYFSYFLIISGIIIFAFINFSKPENFYKTSSRNGFSMNTIINISINSNFSDSENQEILNGAFNLLSSLDNLLSLYNPESEISKINLNAGKSAFKSNEFVFEAVSEAKKFYEITDGVFNPLIGPVTKLWKINKADNIIPSTESLDQAIKLSNIENLELKENFETNSNEKSKKIFLKLKGSAIDLGGIAKGYASQKIAEYLKNKNIKSALIDLGGNIYVIGKNKNSQDWKIGIRNPVKPDSNPALVLSVKDCAVITSGNYERFKNINGKKYSHFFDPLTGKSVNSDLLSVSLITPDGSMADALATAFMIMNFEKSLKILNSKNLSPEKNLPTGAIFIKNSDSSSGIEIYASKNLKEKIIKSDYEIIYF